MKVCDLALFSPATSSGVKTYIESKIEYIRSRKQIEHVVIVPGREDRVFAQGRSKVIVVRGVPCFYPDIRIGINIRRIAELIQNESPDIIELNCQFTLAWAAFLATRRRRAPIVGIYHTDVPACARHLARRGGPMLARAVERTVAFYEGLIYRHCTLTIILNHGMRDRVKSLGVERIRCLPCGVDTTVFAPTKRDSGFRAKHGITARKILLYAGRLSAEKELDLLLSAHERLPPQEFTLVIAGDGPDAGAVTRRAATQPGVKYLGHVGARQDLASIYASCDIFVMPGRYETFGMATLEAMASGLPVVGIEGSGTATLVRPQIGRLARAGDVEDLARKIVEVGSWSPESARGMCRLFTSDNFSWDVVFDRYFEMYHELIEGASRRAHHA